MSDSLPNTCTRWEVYLSDSHPDNMPPDRRTEFYNHTTTCEDCAAALRDYLAIDTLLQYLPSSTPPPELPASLLRLWEEEDRAAQQRDSIQADEPTIQPIAHNGDETVNNTYALIIGVSRYQSPHLRDLPRADRDAHALRNLLLDRWGYLPAHIEMLAEERASLANVRAALHSLTSRGGSQASVLVYFLGHAITDLVSGDAPHGYLCLWDTDPYQLGRTALPDTELNSILRTIAPRKTVIILDAYRTNTRRLPKLRSVVRGGLPEYSYDLLCQRDEQIVLASRGQSPSSYAASRGTPSVFLRRLMHVLAESANELAADQDHHLHDVFAHLATEKQRTEPSQEPMLNIYRRSNRQGTSHVPIPYQSYRGDIPRTTYMPSILTPMPAALNVLSAPEAPAALSQDSDALMSLFIETMEAMVLSLEMMSPSRCVSGKVFPAYQPGHTAYSAPSPFTVDLAGEARCGDGDYHKSI